MINIELIEQDLSLIEDECNGEVCEEGEETDIEVADNLYRQYRYMNGTWTYIKTFKANSCTLASPVVTANDTPKQLRKQLKLKHKPSLVVAKTHLDLCAYEDCAKELEAYIERFGDKGRKRLPTSRRKSAYHVFVSEEARRLAQADSVKPKDERLTVQARLIAASCAWKKYKENAALSLKK